MENKKYLLYIDILGFSDLVENESGKIPKLFTIIDSLNVHEHFAFQTIVFSDTILVFNKNAPLNTHDHEYLVMYACEFVQDLMNRCVELEMQFRAILTYGEFHYEKLRNIEAYHGKALISAYLKEKTIDAIGLFLDHDLLKYNRIFSTSQFDVDLHFVYLTTTIEGYYKTFGGCFPVDPFMIEETDDFYNYPCEVNFIKLLKHNADNQISSKIRSKYLHTYHFYKKRYVELINLLETSDFDFKIICPNADWSGHRYKDGW